MIYVIFLQLMLAISFLVSKQLLWCVSPLWIVGLRMGIGGFLLIAWTSVYHRQACYISKRNLLPLFLVALCGVFLTNFCEAWGLLHVVAAKGYFVYTFGPFLGALLGFLVFQEKMSLRKWLGLLIGFFGFLPLVFSGGSPAQSFTDLWNLFPFIMASMATTIGWIAMKYLLVKQRYWFIMANGVSMLVGGLAAIVLAILFYDPFPVCLFQVGNVALLAVNICLTCLVAYNLYAWLLLRFSATYTLFSGFMGTLFVAIGGWFFLGESLGSSFWIAFGTSLCGVYLFYREEEKIKS